MKKIATFLLAAVLSLSLCSAASVHSALAANVKPELDYVTDAAGVLSKTEQLALETQAEEISQQYECGVYIITVDDYTAYGDGSVYDIAKTLYQEQNLGYGAEQDGELLLLSMNDRDYSLIAYGYGNTAFTDYGKDKLTDEFLDNFADDDWAGGFTDYLNKSADMLAAARSGMPVDIDSLPVVKSGGVAIAILLGCGISLIICLILRSGMKSVAEQAEASAYILSDSINITVHKDTFTRRTETRTKIEKDSSSGGTTVDDDGFSGSSGKF